MMWSFSSLALNTNGTPRPIRHMCRVMPLKLLSGWTTWVFQYLRLPVFYLWSFFLIFHQGGDLVQARAFAAQQHDYHAAMLGMGDFRQQPQDGLHGGNQGNVMPCRIRKYTRPRTTLYVQNTTRLGRHGVVSMRGKKMYVNGVPSHTKTHINLGQP